MKKFATSTLIVLIGLLIMTSASPTYNPRSEEKRPDNIDPILEMQSYKLPIISHILTLLTTMYDGQHDYKMIKGPNGQEQPCFCHGYECPKFTVLCKNAFYEVRKYEAGKSILTTVPYNLQDIESETSPISIGFRRLIKYLHGHNDKGIKINMTLPVAIQSKYTEVNDSHTTHVTKEKQIFIHIPTEFQKETPVPTDPEVKIIDFPEHVLYVKMFGGLMLKHLWTQKKARFFEVLKTFNQTVSPSYRAVGLEYDKPSILINRHNEILYLANEVRENNQYCEAQSIKIM